MDPHCTQLEWLSFWKSLQVSKSMKTLISLLLHPKHRNSSDTKTSHVRAVAYITSVLGKRLKNTGSCQLSLNIIQTGHSFDQTGVKVIDQVSGMPEEYKYDINTHTKDHP